MLSMPKTLDPMDPRYDPYAAGSLQNEENINSVLNSRGQPGWESPEMRAAREHDEAIANANARAAEASRPYQAQNSYYGGYDGGANDMSGLGLSGMNWAMGEAKRDRGAQAVEDQILSDREAEVRYGDQSGAMQLHREAALGMAPSEAAWLMQQGLDRSVASQQSMAGSARGAAALAQAQSGAAANVASLQNQAFTAGGALRAAEMAQARGAYGDYANQMRQQDQNRLGMANDMSRYNAGANDAYKLGMGQLGLGYYQGAQRPLESQLAADTQTEGMRSNSADQQRLIAAGQQQAARDRQDRLNDRWIQAGATGLQIGGGIIGGMMGGPPGAAAGAAAGKTIVTGTFNSGIGRKDPGY